MAMVKKVMGHKAAMTNALVAAWLALAALGGVCAQPAPQPALGHPSADLQPVRT